MTDAQYTRWKEKRRKKSQARQAAAGDGAAAAAPPVAAKAAAKSPEPGLAGHRAHLRDPTPPARRRQSFEPAASEVVTFRPNRAVTHRESARRASPPAPRDRPSSDDNSSAGAQRKGKSKKGNKGKSKGKKGKHGKGKGAK